MLRDSSGIGKAGAMSFLNERKLLSSTGNGLGREELPGIGRPVPSFDEPSNSSDAREYPALLRFNPSGGNRIQAVASLIAAIGPQCSSF
jgi:hypothetical protein